MTIKQFPNLHPHHALNQLFARICPSRLAELGHRGGRTAAPHLGRGYRLGLGTPMVVMVMMTMGRVGCTGLIWLSLSAGIQPEPLERLQGSVGNGQAIRS